MKKKIEEKKAPIVHHHKKVVEHHQEKIVEHHSEKKVKAEEKPRTLELKTEHEIAMDYAVKVYKKFDKAVKSIILFGSTAKQETTKGSDIDIIIIIDDVSIKWDVEMIAWYREELGKISMMNPYQIGIHVNTIKLSTWWNDIMKTDPVVINVLRSGYPLIDIGGFFEPLKFLLAQGRIKPSPEAIYNNLQRAPIHLSRFRLLKYQQVEALYWCMVDSAPAALIAAGNLPPSKENITLELKTAFVDRGKLDKRYISWYRELMILEKRIAHGEMPEIKGEELDVWSKRTEDFLDTMAKLVNVVVSEKNKENKK